MRRVASLSFVAAIALAACQSAHPSAGPATPSRGPSPIAAPLTVGLEYALPGLAQSYARTGVKYAKAPGVFAVWGNVEPVRGKYAWGPLDALVAEYQAAGFSGLQVDLSALSPWASKAVPTARGPGDAFPQEKYLADYGRFVGSLVERYDGDGKDDMPGLRYPIQDFGIERDLGSLWPGSADEYLRLLRTAYPAVKAADPDARVLLAGLLMTDVFDGQPTPVQVSQRLALTPAYLRKSAADIEKVLAACDSYDVVDFQSLGNYTEIPSTTAWIRAKLAAKKCANRPIWIGDALPMSALVGYGGATPAVPFAPATIATRDKAVAALVAVANPAAAGHAEALAWLQAETARGLVKKLVVAAGAQVAGIDLGSLEDSTSGAAGADEATVPATGAATFMGLADTTLTSAHPGGPLPFTGQQSSQAREAGRPRPAYHALALAVSKVGHYRSVEKLDLEAGVWGYRFETASGPVLVVWYDDGVLHLPGEAPPARTVSVPFDARVALVTTTPTSQGQPEPETKLLVAGGKLSIDLSSTPVFVEPRL